MNGAEPPHAEARAVEIGIVDDTRVQILRGVAAGERVLTR